jgi:5'-3' exonuclease
VKQPNFYILRELVTFGGKHVSQGQQLLDAQSETRTTVDHVEPEESWLYAKPLQILHISILREYLIGEFSQLAGVLPFDYDFERIVDDFVFVCFFVGESFAIVMISAEL